LTLSSWLDGGVVELCAQAVRASGTPCRQWSERSQAEQNRSAAISTQHISPRLEPWASTSPPATGSASRAGTTATTTGRTPQRALALVVNYKCEMPSR
jgi:hypothetical protein